MRRLVYPKGSAYRSEVGGLMGALRELDVQQSQLLYPGLLYESSLILRCSNHEVRDYHAKYYVPHNLSLIVAGSFNSGTKSLLSVVQDKIEPTLIANGYNKGARPPGWVRPFVETPTACRTPIKSQVDTVEFPEKDESVGELLFVYQGPSTKDHLTRKVWDDPLYVFSKLTYNFRRWTFWPPI